MRPYSPTTNSSVTTYPSSLDTSPAHTTMLGLQHSPNMAAQHNQSPRHRRLAERAPRPLSADESSLDDRRPMRRPESQPQLKNSRSATPLRRKPVPKDGDTPERRRVKTAISKAELRTSSPAAVPSIKVDQPIEQVSQTAKRNPRPVERGHEHARPRQEGRDQSPRPSTSNPRQSRPPSPATEVDPLEAKFHQMRLSTAPAIDQSQDQDAKQMADWRNSQRKEDEAWETNGLWDNQRQSAREAEDRTRREAERAIAYPPAKPRNPIRAAPSGVTSVHVGVRPRLHPSHASDSAIRNQPDQLLPIPILSPIGAYATPLPDLDDEIQASALEKAQRAREEYERWLERKDEREGGVADDNHYGGTRDWAPKGRMVAVPGSVDGLAHSDDYVGPRVQANTKVQALDPVGKATTVWNDAAAVPEPLVQPIPPTQYANPYGVDENAWWDAYAAQMAYWNQYNPMMYEYSDTPWKEQYTADGKTVQFEDSENSPSQSDASGGYQYQEQDGLSYPSTFLNMFNQPSYPHPYTFPQSSPYGQMGQQQSGPSNPGHFPGVDMSMMGMPFNRNAMASPTSYGGNYSAGGLGGAPGHMQQDPMAAWGYGNQSNQGSMYNPYMSMMGQGRMPQMNGNNGMPGAQFGGMMNGMSPHLMSQPGMMGNYPGAGQMDSQKPFDSTQMKRGRMGHYGYLEGRELAGPPVGQLPAGVLLPTASHQTQQQMTPATTHVPPPASAYSGASAPIANSGMAAPTATSATSSQARGWNESALTPRARYDGSSAGKVVQADLDSPYPRTKAGGVASAWSRYGMDNEVVNGIDGRMGISHKRIREGRV